MEIQRIPNTETDVIANAILNEAKISSLEEKKIHNSIVEIIALVIWESGFNVSAEEQKILISYMINEIKTYFKHLTLTEIKIALQKGVRGYYGDVMGMNVRMLHKWIYTYTQEIRAGVVVKLLERKVKKEATEEDKKRIRKMWLETWIDNYEKYTKDKNAKPLDLCGMFYDYLKSLEIVSLSKQEVNSIWKKAVKEYQYNQKRGSMKWMAQFASVIKSGKKEGELSKDATEIKFIAKNMALCVLFDKIKTSGISLRDVIMEKEEVFKNK